MPNELQVAIYGAGSGGELIRRCLDGTGCRAVVYFDGDPAKQGRVLGGVPVDAPKNVSRHDFDRLIIASATVYEEAICKTLLELGVPTDKIVPRTLLTNNMTHRIRCYGKSAGVRACVTGMSYHRQAVVPELSEFSIFNAASTSQDLYFDLAIARAMLGTGVDRPAAWLLGLTYYSLHYDMSLSKTWPCVFYYKDLFGYHHLEETRKEYYLNRFDSVAVADSLPSTVLDNLAREEHRSLVLDNTGTFDFGGSDATQLQARTDGNKWYPGTVAENKGILKAFVQLLLENGITPILTFIPFPASYPIRTELADECFEFVAGLERKYGCRTLNGYEMTGFIDQDFYDTSHLNIHGGQKFTALADALLRAL
ncbi:hypothetical protein GKC30_07765 [Pseudodesulfovibrio sp. F-1]|uniref:Uncharacterized protein n=1 Tax=Pseudodesulfovibrio alkaliphilus TaxID=2661613 RepID=A0A7K1KN67_9BACT|nr:hypothetical protein [Pseudodesulfovibrio alkaliphilus]MUM77524.1 hypothetical protein [Pseudodesulfovibrio alkaliphilus]